MAFTVAMFSPGWPEQAFPNGIVTYVSNVRRGLLPLGVGVDVLAASLEGAAEEPGIHGLETLGRASTLTQKLSDIFGYRIVPQQMFGRRIARAALALYHRRPFQLFEIEESFGAANFVQRALNVPVVVRLHGPWFLSGAGLGIARDREFAAREQAEARAIRNADAMSAPSRNVLDRVRDHLGLRLEHACVIPNPGPVVRREETWRLDESDPEHVLFVGRFDRLKGGDTVIRAFARLAARRPRAHLTFVGPDRGCIDDRGRNWSLPDFVAHACGDPNVRTRIQCTGQLPRQHIDMLRRRARVTVVASRYETFAMTVSEAMAFGCPLVAGAAGAIPELVRHEQSALLFEPERDEELAQCIETLLADPQRCARLGQAAREHFERELTPESVGKRTVEFYAAVLSQGKRSAQPARDNFVRSVKARAYGGSGTARLRVSASNRL